MRPATIAFDGADTRSSQGKIAHGDRLAWVLGCRGCHGKQLEGQLWDDDPQGYGVTWASNLTRAVPAMTDAQLNALLRNGIHPVRREMWLMPSEIFQHLSDADTGALIAYLRSLAPRGNVSPPPQLGPRARKEIASGKVKAAAALVAELASVGPYDAGAQHATGRYISRLTCAECHGPKLEGVPGDTPDLSVAGSYSRDEFERLLATGVPTGGRQLKELMQDVAKNRYSRLTRDERDAVYAYLKARAERPQ